MTDVGVSHGSMLNMYFMCDYTNCAPPSLVSMFGSLKRTGDNLILDDLVPILQGHAWKSTYQRLKSFLFVSPTLPKAAWKNHILAGGCSQHEKASCMAITLDIGRSLDIDTWINKNKSISKRGWTLTSSGGTFLGTFLHLKVWWIACAPQFFGSQFYTYDLWRLGWEIDVWCGLEVFDHLCMVIICDPDTPEERHGRYEDDVLDGFSAFPVFQFEAI